MPPIIKYAIIFCTLVFTAVEIISAVEQFSSTRIITVTKKVKNTQTTELKGYPITKDHFETADIKVQPVSFSDGLLLTSDKGNLLSILLKIAACFSFAWYVFKLRGDNFFSARSYGTAYLSCFFYGLSVFAYSGGWQHTIEFWNNTYWRSRGLPEINLGFVVVDNSQVLPTFLVLATLMFFYQMAAAYYSKRQLI